MATACLKYGSLPAVSPAALSKSHSTSRHLIITTANATPGGVGRMTIEHLVTTQHFPFPGQEPDGPKAKRQFPNGGKRSS